MSKITPLLKFLRALSPEQREAFASAVGTTVLYLYQVAAQPSPNPRLQLAKRLVDESKPLAKRAKAEPLTYEDLLVGAARPDAE